MTEEDFPTISNEDADIDARTVERLVETVHRITVA